MKAKRVRTTRWVTCGWARTIGGVDIHVYAQPYGEWSWSADGRDWLNGVNDSFAFGMTSSRAVAMRRAEAAARKLVRR